MNRTAILFITLFFIVLSPVYAQAPEKAAAPAPQPKEDKLSWWPTDAKPAPVKDEQMGGFWWWPTAPGTTKDLWGNRGYAYVNKIIYDWHGRGGNMKDVQVKISDVGFVETVEKPSLLLKRILRSKKLQFKGNAADISLQSAATLKKAVGTLKRDDDASVLMSALNDTPELGAARTQAVEKFLVGQGIAKERIMILAPEKFKEVGLSVKEQVEPGTIYLIIAEVKEIMISRPK